MMKKVCYLLCLLLVVSCHKENKLTLNFASGNSFGTTYSVQFIASEKIVMSRSYDSLVLVINASMSTYQEDSAISRINKGDTTVVVDAHFEKVFESAVSIYKETAGIFDPTIGVLVNAWDFGPEGKVTALDSLKIDSLLATVGLDKVRLEHGKIVKQHPATFLDFNASAKGYAVDVFADFLASKGYTDYLVEIGGEIRAKGRNIVKQKPWRIGVEDPNFDASQSYSKVISLMNEAMATSGSYRKYKVDAAGNRYAHIIDTKTGYPHQSNLLSVSVVAPTCMEADAYATAFMSMGLSATVSFLEAHPALKAYLIYEDDQQELQTKALNGFAAE